MEVSETEKSLLRDELRRGREAHGETVRRTADAQICRSILSLDALSDLAVIAGYRAHGAEANIDAALVAMLRRGVAVAFPKVAPGRQLEWRVVRDLDRDFEQGSYGIQEPTTPPIESPEVIQAVLTPGLGFDRRGQRLGAGKGYYDTFFQGAGTSILRIGIAYDSQLVEQIPTDVWDQAMDWIITESETICCRGVGGDRGGMKPPRGAPGQREG